MGERGTPRHVHFESNEDPAACGVVGGLLTLNRLRAIPEEERRALVRRMLLKKKRRRLAEIAVNQWKWVARFGLRRIAEERQRAKELIAMAHYRSHLQWKTLKAVQKYALFKRETREIHAADRFHSAKWFSKWSQLTNTHTTARKMGNLSILHRHLSAWSVQHKSSILQGKLQNRYFKTWVKKCALKARVDTLRAKTAFYNLRKLVRVRHEAAEAKLTIAGQHHDTFLKCKVLKTWVLYRRAGSLRERNLVKTAYRCLNMHAVRMAELRKLALERTVERSVEKKVFRIWRSSLLNRTVLKTTVLPRYFARLRCNRCVKVLNQYTTRAVLLKRFKTLKKHREIQVFKRHVTNHSVLYRYGTWRSWVLKRKTDKDLQMKIQLAKMKHSADQLPHNLGRAMAKPRPLPRNIGPLPPSPPPPHPPLSQPVLVTAVELHPVVTTVRKTTPDAQFRPQLVTTTAAVRSSSSAKRQLAEKLFPQLVAVADTSLMSSPSVGVSPSPSRSPSTCGSPAGSCTEAHKGAYEKLEEANTLLQDKIKTLMERVELLEAEKNQTPSPPPTPPQKPPSKLPQEIFHVSSRLATSMVSYEEDLKLVKELLPSDPLCEEALARISEHDALKERLVSLRRRVRDELKK